MEFGFIGVGAMGGPLARNLIRAGKTVHVYNRSAAGRDKTLAVGTSGLAATSMAHMAPCNVVFTCLALPEHLMEKALGPDGLYAHMQPGAVHVELSTIDSQTAFALAEAAGKQGVAYVQCTLGKTPAHAERGEAPLFVGGDQQAIAALAEVWPILGVFNNVGTVEAACAVKLVSNLVGMANLAVLSEGLRIGEAAGVDKNLLLHLLAETGAAIAHCPTSNFFLGSGAFSVHQARQAALPVKVGLATDIGAGTSFSMLATMGAAYKAAQLNGNALTARQAFYLATRGGAEALGIADKVGSLAVGLEADLCVLDLHSTPLIDFRMQQADSLDDVLFVQMMLADDRAVAATWVAGRCVYSAAAA